MRIYDDYIKHHLLTTTLDVINAKNVLKKLAIPGLAAVLIAQAGSLFAQASPSGSIYQYRVPMATSSSVSAAELNVLPSALSFADLVVGQSASSAIILENRGNTSLTGLNVGYTGGTAFTINASTCSSALGPGQSCAVGVSFAPPSRGDQSGSIEVISTSGQVVIPLVGRGLQGQLQASSGSLVFSPVIVGASSSRILQINNTGDALVSGVGFSADAPFYPGSACSTIAPGATCDLVLQFNPTEAGGYNGNLRLSSPVGQLSVALSGSASAAESIPTIISGNPVAFGNKEQNSAYVDRVVSIRNTGNVPMTLTGVVNLPSAVSLVQNTCSGIQPSNSCDLTLRMSTTSVTSISATVSLQGASSPATLELTGGVLAPQIAGSAGFMVGHLYDEGDESGTSKTWYSAPVSAYSVFKNTSGSTITIDGVKSCGLLSTQLYTVTSASGPATLGGAYSGPWPFSTYVTRFVSGTRNYSLAGCASGAWNTSIGSISVPNGAYFLMEDASITSGEAVLMARTTTGKVITVRKPATTSFYSSRYPNMSRYFNGMTDYEFVSGQLEVN